MSKKISIIIILTVLLTSCGFKKINQEKSLVYLQNIKIDGENRIAYTLKNNMLLISDISSKNKYNAEVKITKRKTIKIKNKSGKISRFELNILSNLTLINIDTQKSKFKHENLMNIHFKMDQTFA